MHLAMIHGITILDIMIGHFVLFSFIISMTSLSPLLVVFSSGECHAHACQQDSMAGISSYPCMASPQSVNDKLFSTIMWQVSEYKLFNLQPKID
jgi:hypothetical protein